ncbi:MAG: gas vesicle protein [Roseicyclus sp.]
MAASDLDLSFATPDDVLAANDGRLVDVLDQLLDAGVVLRGELWLSVADVDLVFLGLQAVLANPDTINAAGGRA